MISILFTAGCKNIISLAGFLTYPSILAPSPLLEKEWHFAKTLYGDYSSGNCCRFSRHSLLFRFLFLKKDLETNYGAKV